MRRILFHCARGVWGQEAPALSFPQTLFFCGRGGVLSGCSGHTDLARGLLRLKWYKRFIRLQRHLAVQGALDARVSLHSRLEARPLRNTAAAYSAPTLRARCFAPTLALGFGVCFLGLSVSGRLVHLFDTLRCVKTTKTSADWEPTRRQTLRLWLRLRAQ